MPKKKTKIEGDWHLINKEEFKDWILLHRSDVNKLVEGAKDLDSQSKEIIMAFFEWMESYNKLNTTNNE